MTQDLKLGISWMNCRMNGRYWESMNVFIKSAMTQLFCFFNFFDKYPKLPSISSCVCPTTRNPNWISLKFLWAINKERNVIGDDSCYLSHNCPFKEVTSLAMASHPQFCSQAFNAFKQRKLPCKICWKNAFWGSNSNKTPNSLIGSFQDYETSGEATQSWN